jgi:hypothetical protein
VNHLKYGIIFCSTGIGGGVSEMGGFGWVEKVEISKTQMKIAVICTNR